MKKITPNSEPYLQIESIRMELRLYKIDARRMIRSGIYGVRVGDDWIELDATEPYISNSGPPTRAVDLHGIGLAVERLLLLEAQLSTSGGLLQMKDVAGEIFDVTYKGMIRSLQVTGLFLAEDDGEEFQCRITIPEHGTFVFTAIEDFRHGNRVLLIGDLNLKTELSLVHTIVAGTTITVKKIPWIH